MEPKVIILDVGKLLLEFRKRCAESAPYLHDTPVSICNELTECAVNRMSPYGELLSLVGRIRHGQSHAAPRNKINSLAMSVGDLGVAMIDSIRRMGFPTAELHEEEKLPYHFLQAKNNIVVLKHNKAA